MWIIKLMFVFGYSDIGYTHTQYLPEFSLILCARTFHICLIHQRKDGVVQIELYETHKLQTPFFVINSIPTTQWVLPRCFVLGSNGMVTIEGRINHRNKRVANQFLCLRCKIVYFNKCSKCWFILLMTHAEGKI